MKRFILAFIGLYQKTVSPDHGVFAYRHPHGFCRYYPTCSEYAKQSITKNGIFRGLCSALYRVIKCNPLSKGGYDPVK